MRFLPLVVTLHVHTPFELQLSSRLRAYRSNESWHPTPPCSWTHGPTGNEPRRTVTSKTSLPHHQMKTAVQPPVGGVTTSISSTPHRGCAALPLPKTPFAQTQNAHFYKSQSRRTLNPTSARPPPPPLRRQARLPRRIVFSVLPSDAPLADPARNRKSGRRRVGRVVGIVG